MSQGGSLGHWSEAGAEEEPGDVQVKARTEIVDPGAFSTFHVEPIGEGPEVEAITLESLWTQHRSELWWWYWLLWNPGRWDDFDASAAAARVPGHWIVSSALNDQPKGDLMANRLMTFFKFEHLPAHLQEPSRSCAELAGKMDESLAESAEKTAGLRKLLEAKDCFVRAKLEQSAHIGDQEVS
jgi:hypothetical protein